MLRSLTTAVCFASATTAHAAAATEPAPPSAAAFDQRTSIRGYFANASAAISSWPVYRLQGVSQLEPRAAAGGQAHGQAWAVESGTRRVWVLSMGEQPAPVTVAGGAPLIVPAGGRLVVAQSGGGGGGGGHDGGSSPGADIFVASAGKITSLHCPPATCTCSQLRATAGPAHSILSAAADMAGTLWLGTERGLFRVNLAIPTSIPTAVAAAGGKSPVLAVALGASCVAAATARAVFWTEVVPGASSHASGWHFVGVGGVLDANVTSLVYAAPFGSSGRPGLFIGTEAALAVLGSDGIVRRLSGLQVTCSLPTPHSLLDSVSHLLPCHAVSALPSLLCILFALL